MEDGRAGGWVRSSTVLWRAVKRLAGTPCVARGILAAGAPPTPPAGYPPRHRRAQVELLAGAQQRMQELVAGEIKQRKMHAARCLELEAAGQSWLGGSAATLRGSGATLRG